MRRPAWCSTLVVIFGIVGIGCGGVTDATPSTSVTGDDGGSGGGGTGGSGGGAGSGDAPDSGGAGASIDATSLEQMPDECRVPSDGPGPHRVKFEFVNPGATPLYLREDCVLRYSIYGCADGYAKVLSRGPVCMTNCAAPVLGDMDCGGCMMGGVEVAAAASYDDAWVGETYSFAKNIYGLDCYDAHAAPAGKYRIVVPVYLSRQAAQDDHSSFSVQIDFDLSSHTDVVRVVLEPAS